MTIKTFLAQLAGFAAYIAALQEQAAAEQELKLDWQPEGEYLTKIDYILSVFGPRPAVLPYGDVGLVFGLTQAVAVGWDEVHVSKWHRVRPSRNFVIEQLELTPEKYELIHSAECLTAGFNQKLRDDIIAACGLPEEKNLPYFQKGR